MASDNQLDRVREIISQLQTPVPDLPTLLSLLSSPLASLGLLPPQFRRYNQNSLHDGSIKISRHVPSIQEAILLKVIPTWEDTLQAHDSLLLVEQYFCPDAFWCSTPEAGNIALLAYSCLLSLPLTAYSIHLLNRLTRSYPIDRLYQAVYAHKGSRSGSESIEWEDCVRNVVAVPAKVANAALANNLPVPALLEHGTYFNNLCTRCEELIFTLSISSSTVDKTSPILFLLSKLVNVGAFPLTRPTSRSQPSFFLSTLPSIRRRLNSDDRVQYSKFWNEIVENVSSIFTSQSILTTLLSSLSIPDSDPGARPKAFIKKEATLLLGLLGRLGDTHDELWDILASVILTREWTESHARTLVCWVAGCNGESIDEEALSILLQRVIDIWSSPDHIKYSLLSQHRYLTSLLLFTISYLTPSSPRLNAIALSPALISGVGTYIAHLDHSVRRCGMLVAEVVAQRAGRQLDFGDWEGDDHGKPWARALREKLAYRDIDATLDIDDADVQVVEPSSDPMKNADTHKSSQTKVSLPPESAYDSDDSLVGYASETSSRSASPTPSELEEIEKDPTLNVGVKKVARPVYLAQLGELLRNTSGKKGQDDPHEADKIETALNCAEELIRKKRNFGSELEENAVNLVYAFIGLQDNYNLDNFEHKRQVAVNALVSCCPRKAAPCIIEQFFVNQYSADQRFTMLNALAIGARELASLPIPPTASNVSAERVSFPSKVLPGPLHRKYLTAGGHNQVLQITDDLSHAAIERSKSVDADQVPEVAREKRLRISQPAKITEVESHRENVLPWQNAQPQKSTTYNEVAAEFFIIPFINRFWMFLRDEQTREERTAHLSGRARYYGAGTGLILNPLILSHFLSTMTVLVHAAQNAPEWLAIIAPDALELAVTLGTRPISHLDDDDEDSSTNKTTNQDNTQTKQASVLSASLELALIVLDGSSEVDGGRTLGLEHTALLIGTGEWAGSVFARLEAGMKAEGGGGMEEIKLRRAAAGVLLKVDEITSKWRRSMIDSVKI